jgi:8-oxo-dGTP diphosphatase
MTDERLSYLLAYVRSTNGVNMTDASMALDEIEMEIRSLRAEPVRAERDKFLDALECSNAAAKRRGAELDEVRAERDRLAMHLRDIAPQKYPVLVVCALIIRNWQVLMERHAPDGINSDEFKWDIPGGKVECGESPEDAVVREILEETGLEIRVIRMVPTLRTSVWQNSKGMRHWILAAYVCEIVSGEPLLNDDLQWIDEADIQRLAHPTDAQLIAEAFKPDPVRAELERVRSVLKQAERKAMSELDIAAIRERHAKRAAVSRKQFTKTGNRRAPSVATAESLAMEWWRADGLYIDPDTEEVDWYDKRRELAEMAFIAGYKKALESRKGGRL